MDNRQQELQQQQISQLGEELKEMHTLLLEVKGQLDNIDHKETKERVEILNLRITTMEGKLKTIINEIQKQEKLTDDYNKNKWLIKGGVAVVLGLEILQTVKDLLL